MFACSQWHFLDFYCLLLNIPHSQYSIDMQIHNSQLPSCVSLSLFYNVYLGHFYARFYFDDEIICKIDVFWSKLGWWAAHRCLCVYGTDNFFCAVYKIALTTGYEATAVSPLVCGIPNPAYTAPSPNPPVPGSQQDLRWERNNKCRVGGIASPRSLSYVKGHDALLIGTLIVTSNSQN